MMALDKRTSMAHKFTRWVVLAGTVSVVALALFHGPVCAQQAAPAAAAEPGAAEPAKSTGQKPKSKSAGTEAKGAKKDPAVAQQQIEAGVASLQAGKADAAVQQFTAALSGGSLPSNLLARAHYQRGLAYRKQSKPALAISDLTHALWLKNGLNDAERADALQNRIAAYRDAGLPDQADAEGSGKSAGTKTATADAAVSSAGSGSTGSIPAAKPAAGLAPSPEAAPAPSGTGLGGFFGNLFGGSSNKSSAAQSTAAVPPKTEPAVSAWSSGTEVKVAAVPAPKAARSAAASPAQSSDAPLPWQQAETAKPAPAKPVAVEAAPLRRRQRSADAICCRSGSSNRRRRRKPSPPS